MSSAEITDRIGAVSTADLARIGYGTVTEHAATGIIVDQADGLIDITDSDVVILPIAQALDTYEWVQHLMFGLVKPDDDPLVAELAESTTPPVGHFIWVKAGAKVTLPVQTFTLLGHPQGRQHLHCLTVIDEGAEVQIISGSTVPANVHAGKHVSISETYLRPGAQVREVSIEQWGDDMEVYDFSRTHIGVGASCTSSAIMMSHVKYYRTDSLTHIEEDGTSYDQTVMYSPEGTERVMHDSIVLDGDRANAESIARMVTEGGRIDNRSTLIGNGSDSRGYLGCDGLKLGETGQITSAPALEANSPTSQLSHEASIGVIGGEKIAYLMASGLEEEQARDLLIQGFLNLDEELIPEGIRADVTEMIATAKSGAL